MDSRYTVPGQKNTESLALHIHEDANTCLMLHTYHATQHGYHQILVQTVDTDVIILAVKLALSLSNEDELWIAFEAGKDLRLLASHVIISSLGLNRAHALPMFHILTWCDTVSFVGYGERSAWET